MADIVDRCVADQCFSKFWRVEFWKEGKPHRTQMNADGGRIADLSKLVIGGALEVARTLGSGCREKVYENALVCELRRRGLAVAQQTDVVVRCDGVVVGEYTADLLVEDTVLVELKAANALDSCHFAQCLNHLRATDLELGLLLNFGKPRLEIECVVLRPGSDY